MEGIKVSIIMLTHNAANYVKLAIDSLKEHTKNVDYELIVVDNASGFRTRHLVKKRKEAGVIDKLILNKSNLLFAKGNNIGSVFVSEECTHILFLNSDVEIKNDVWLKKLLAICPEGGISAYGIVLSEPVRADGYCMLIAKELFFKYRLDETFEWFWSITKLQSQALREGKKVVAVENYEEMIHHFGGKSGNAFRNANGMNTEIREICSWFAGKQIDRIKHI